jgi:uncharacterized protein YrrD
MRDTFELRGARVLGGRRGTKRIGKVGRAVFHPQTYRLVGYLVKRPDLALVRARSDRFLAFDSFRIIDGAVVGSADYGAWDASACKRLKLNFDACILLEGMPIIAQDEVGKSLKGERHLSTRNEQNTLAAPELLGDPVASVSLGGAASETINCAAAEPLGYVASVVYDELSGELITVKASDGAAAKALLGTQNIPRELLLGYCDGAVWVKPGAKTIAHSGGLAAKAGVQAAKAGDKVVRTAAKAGARAEEVATNAAIRVGRAAKSHAAKGRATKGHAVREGADTASQRQVAASEKTAAAIEESARAVGRQLSASKGMFKAFRDEYRKAAASGKRPSNDKRPVQGTGAKIKSAQGAGEQDEQGTAG